ncbi:MAG: Linear gramicidin synthase subunit B [bacterium ADurb.Bin243]|nr:MAG: Linear gramicidin synthase subunit B [bacterium ADurb.Bin243]
MNDQVLKYYELSHPEKRLYYLQKYYPETSMWNVAQTVVFKIPVNSCILKKAINLFVRNNQNMRIRFAETETGPGQYEAPFEETEIETFSFTGPKASEDLNEWAEKESRRPFKNFTDAPLYRIHIIALDNERGGFYINAHHMIIDGASLAIATDKIIEYYERLKGGEADISEKFTPYFNYLKEEADYLASKDFENDRRYWFEKYKTDIEQLELRPVRDKEDFTVRRSYHTAPAGLSKKIYAYCDKNKISVFKLFMSALFIYFHRLTMKEDIVIQTTHHGRSEEFKNSTGMFLSSLPVRFTFSGDSTFSSICSKFVPEFKEALSHMKFPGDMLAAEFRRLNRDPQNLFAVALSQFVKNRNRGNVETRCYCTGETFSQLAFYLSYDAAADDEIEFFIDHRVSMYQQGEINYMAGHIYELINQAIEDDGKKISSYDFLSDKEKRRLLYEFNDNDSYYPEDKTFVEIFEEQAAKTPDKKAVVFLNESISYKRLKNKGDALAARLRSLGAGRDDIVGIFVDRSIEMFIGAVGVLKSGAAFMPIDTKYPMDRIEFMLEDSRARVLVTQKHLMDKIKFNGTVIDLEDQSLYDGCAEIESVSRPEDLAYVIYTSGSTGKPKGTLIEHRALLNFSYWYKNSRAITEEDRLAKHASFGFDASIVEVFPPLIAGAEIHIISEEIKLSLGELNDYFEKNEIRGCFLTTQFAEQFLENIDNKSLRYLDTGGEKLRTFTKRGYRFYNCYGPTECTVYTTFFPVDKMYANIPIGKPLANTKVYIVDRNGNLMPEGYCGELCVSGVCLSRGYLNRPDTTAEKFVKNPFNEGERLYKTGDLVRWLPDGNIEYIGRIDNQVKLRGFRIELGEIEIEIMKVKGVKNAAVTLAADGDNKFICAYIVAEKSLTHETIKKEISQNLPEFMIPNYFISLDEMPVNASGKIDRKALPAPRIKSEAKSDYIAPAGECELRLAALWKETLAIDNVGALDNFFKIGGHSLKAVILQAKIEKEFGLRMSIKKIFDNPSLRDMAAFIEAGVSAPAMKKKKSSDMAAFENGVEEKIVKIWEEVLSLDGICALDNFFKIGGHSIKMVSLQYKIEKEFGVRVPVKKLFEMPTARLQAEFIINAGGAASGGTAVKAQTAEISRGARTVESEALHYPVSSVQKRLFIVETMEGPSASYNLPFTLKINGKLDRLKFSEAIEKMADRHEALRTSFSSKDGEPFQVVHPSIRLKKIFQDASDGVMQEYIDEMIKPFDLSQAPLFRVKLMKVSDDEHLLFLNFHHIIFDGMSLEIFIRELFDLYHGRSLSPLKEHYGDFCLWQKKFLASSAIDEQEKVWFEMLSGDVPTLNMPTDFSRPPKPSLDGDQFEFFADAELTARLKNFAQATGNTLYTVILAAYNILLSRYSQQEDIVVGTPLVGRPSMETQNMLGMFVNTMPARNYPKPDKKFGEFLAEVRSTFLNIIDNQDYQLDMLIDKLGIKRASGHNPLFDTVFVYQTSKGLSEASYGDLRVKPQEINTRTAKFDLTLQAFESEESMKFSLEYRKCLFKDDTVARMSTHLINILDEVSRDPEIYLKDIELVAPAERKTVLYDFNRTALKYDENITIYEYFEKTAEKYAANTALVFRDRKLTYAQLNDHANKFARRLMEKGVKKGDFVAQLADKSAEMVIGLLAIMKAGACYVPIDPSYPADRVEFMLTDTRASAVIGQKKNIDETAYGGPKIAIDDYSIYESASGGENIGRIAGPRDLAYAIYTSGSTGKPKGVMIEHRSLINLAECLINEFNLTSADRFTQYMSICFDPSIGSEIFPSLFTGGELHVIAPELRLLPVEINNYMEANGITFSIFPTQFYEQFAELTDNKSARYISCGGDKLKNYHQKNYTLVNAYGPTEYTVITTMFRVDRQYDNIPIGKGVSNTRMYVLDKNNKLLPIGIPGELCIAGDGIARGYLNRPELNGEKFPADPFYPGERMYRTGDLVRWLPDGNIEFLGRIDFQVKIRGFRIELGEIDAQLQKHEDIETAVVLAKEDEQKNKYLCAFYTAKRDITAKELKEFLALTLANYMIPSYFIKLDEFPLNTSGKVDRKAVAAIEIKAGGAEERILPSNEREEKIAKAWREVLGLKEVGVNENFFEIGGHSLKAVTLAAKLQQDFEVNINDIFKCQTIGALAAQIKEKKGTLQNKLESLKTKVPAVEQKMNAYLASKEFKAAAAAYAAENKKYEAVDVHARNNYKSVLLTGATGYLGVHLLHDLLKGWKCDIYLPVRGKTPGDSLKRVNEKYRYYFGSELKSAELERIKILCADLEKERLGLDEKEYREACEKIDAIIHSAANVKHYGRYEEFYGPNVKSVENLIELAAAGKKKDFNHISTMSVTDGKIAGAENAVFTEDCCDIGQKSDNLYIQTKLEAEKMVIAAREKYGLKTNIFRVGNISFNSKTGHLQQNVEENAFSVTIKSFVNLGVVPETSDEAELSFVDSTSAAVLALFDRKNLYNQIYHSQNTFTVKLSEVLTSPLLGLNMEKLPFDKFIDRLNAEFGVECRRQHVENILLHRGWLENEEDSTACATLIDRTSGLLSRIGFEWPKVDETKMVDLIAMALRERLEFIKELSLFNGVAYSVQREIAFMSKEVVFREGSDIVWEGDPVNDLYLIFSGNAEVQKTSKAGWLGTIMITGRGDFLGFESLSGGKSNITAETIMGDLRALAINGTRLKQTLLTAPELCFNLLTAVSETAQKLEGIITNID